MSQRFNLSKYKKEDGRRLGRGKSKAPFGSAKTPLPETNVAPVSRGPDFFKDARTLIRNMCGFDATNLEFPEPGQGPVLIDLGSAKFIVRVYDITDEFGKRTYESGFLDDAYSASEFIGSIVGAGSIGKLLPFCLDACEPSMSLDVNSFVRIEARRIHDSFEARVSMNAVHVDVTRTQ
jgi:hypothetical protein